MLLLFWINEDKGDISSNTKTVLSLFFDAYFGYANSLNDVNNIVSYYHDIVSSSNELTQTEKICILMCIEITKYSYSFWQDYGLQWNLQLINTKALKDSQGVRHISGCHI